VKSNVTLVRQIESTEVCSSGLGRNPDKRIRISNDHHSRLRRK
jgi:hypothetical protein